jgi:hypothetical protein
MQKDNQYLIKNEVKLGKQDENFLREKFITEYAKNKGWDQNNLSPTQMLEIVQQNGYKNPGLLLS